MAESLPTSVSAFTHRRARADSTASFAFYDDEEPEESPFIDDEDAESRGRADLDDMWFGEEAADEDDSTDVSADLERQAPDNDYVLHRRASTLSRGSVRSRLLRRDSGLSGESQFGRARFSQKTHMVNEDLYIVIAGFRTSRVGMVVYILLCILTFGLAWLLFRWVPKWYIKLTGKPSTLRDCEWVVIEVSYAPAATRTCRSLHCQNSWNEMAILDVNDRPYGRSISTVFGTPDKVTSYLFDEDQDPILRDLRTLDYRYVRFFYHPARDKFLLCHGWKDPAWTDVRAVRSGVDSDEKSHRELVFGDNLIDIEQKSTFRLLVDEVRLSLFVLMCVVRLTSTRSSTHSTSSKLQA
jgi:cation-transporting ATPase 13A2